ncbi:MAG TPA: DUF255 domain-containing protein [Candidatus Polarisedimenticolia bacterium]
MTRHARRILLSFSAVLLFARLFAAEPAQTPPADKGIRWRGFEPASFQAARDEGKLVLLSIQSPWGHWDRVMSELTFADPRLISVVNEKFIPIKADALLRPDIGDRYTVGGTPTTTILLPTGLPFYFPDAGGKIVRAGGNFYTADPLAFYLLRLVDYYAANKETASKAADEIARRILERKEIGSAPLAPDILEVSVTRMLEGFGEWQPDPQAKGGRSPDADSLELALYYFVRKGDRNVLDRGLHMMTDMARGGIRDQIGGGFHRSAQDAAWRVPTFEKLLATNARMLQAATDANRLTLSGRFRAIAEETASYVLNTLADPEGWFYAYQAADARLGDDGDYYTWTIDEAKAALSEEEQKIILPAFDIGESGELVDSAPRRNVLFLKEGPPLLSQRLGMEEAKVKEIFEAGRKKLLEARSRRPAPPVGKVLVTDAGAEMAAALIMSGDAWKRADLRDAGLKAIDTTWERARDPNTGLMDHVWTPGGGRTGLAIFFADQAQMARALIAAQESTGDARYLDRCRQIVDAADKAFADSLDGGYMDRTYWPDAPGILSWPSRSIRDNAVFAETLTRLNLLSGRPADDRYLKMARKTLESWSDEYANLKQASSPYGLAAHRFQTPPVEILVIGTSSDAGYETLHARAKALYHPWKVIRHLTAQDAEQELKARRAVSPAKGSAAVLFCMEARCAGPFTAADNLALKLDEFVNVGARPATPPAGEDKDKED